MNGSLKVLSPLLLTLKVPGVATLVALLTGVAIAFLLARGKSRGREWLDAMPTLPLVMPPTVLGYYLIVLVRVTSPSASCSPAASRKKKIGP